MTATEVKLSISMSPINTTITKNEKYILDKIFRYFDAAAFFREYEFCLLFIDKFSRKATFINPNNKEAFQAAHSMILNLIDKYKGIFSHPKKRSINAEDFGNRRYMYVLISQPVYIKTHLQFAFTTCYTMRPETKDFCEKRISELDQADEEYKSDNDFKKYMSSVSAVIRNALPIFEYIQSAVETVLTLQKTNTIQKITNSGSPLKNLDLTANIYLCWCVFSMYSIAELKETGNDLLLDHFMNCTKGDNDL